MVFLIPDQSHGCKLMEGPSPGRSMINACSFFRVQMAQTLVELLDVNVFAVDWSSGSLPLYTQATANTRLVGLEIAHFVKFLRVR